MNRVRSPETVQAGPLPIVLHPAEGPGVQVFWMPHGVLLVGIYTTERKGTVYRWDNGLEQPPAVIYWDLDGPGCGS